jgi:hypothetical protein
MMRRHILIWAMRHAATHINAAGERGPDFVIGDRQLERWWLIPRNRVFNIYLHRFNHSDEDRALHDHPWISLGWILNRGYYEVLCDRVRYRPEGSWTWRLPTTAHRVELRGAPEQAVYTLFFTGPVWRQWGFHCPQGWRHWKQFIAPETGAGTGISIRGRGCE